MSASRRSRVELRPETAALAPPVLVEEEKLVQETCVSVQEHGERQLPLHTLGAVVRTKGAITQCGTYQGACLCRYWYAGARTN